MTEDFLSMLLSQEELVVLLRILRAPGILGLDTKFLNNMSTEQVAAALVAAERSLYARGLIQVNENENRVDIDATALALVGTCLLPEYTLMAFSNDDNSLPSIHYYHVSSSLAVEFFSREQGLLSFLGTDQAQKLLPSIENILRLRNQKAPAKQSICLPEDSFVQAWENMKSGKRKLAEEIFQKEKAHKPTFDALLKSLEKPICNGSVIRLDATTDNKNQTSGFSFIEGKDGIWIISPEKKNDTAWVNISPCSADEVRASICALLN